MVAGRVEGEVDGFGAGEGGGVEVGGEGEGVVLGWALAGRRWARTAGLVTRRKVKRRRRECLVMSIVCFDYKLSAGEADSNGRKLRGCI